MVRLRPARCRHAAVAIVVPALLAALAGGCAGSAGRGREPLPWSGEPGEGGKLVEVSGEYGRRRNAARILEVPRRDVARTMKVGSRSAYLHESPDVRSRPVALLCAGDTVSVAREAEFIRMPEEADMREYVGAGRTGVTPTWVQATCGPYRGWVPARTLVDPAVLAAADPSFGVAERLQPEPAAVGGVLSRAMPPAWFGDDADPFVDPPPPQVPRAVPDSPGQPDGRVGAGARVVPSAQSAPDRMLGQMGELGIRGAGDPGLEAARQASLTLERQLRATSQPFERLFGRECHARRLTGTVVLPQDHPASRYVRWLGWRLAAPSSNPYPSWGFAFVVAEEDGIDAVGFPGGPVLVTTGLLRALAREDELAAVLACEIARVEEREGLSIAQSCGVFAAPSEEDIRRQSEARWASRSTDAAVAKASTEAQLSALRDQFSRSLAVAVDRSVGTEAARGQVSLVDSLMVFSRLGRALPARAMSLSCAAGFDPSALVDAVDRIRKAASSSRYDVRLRGPVDLAFAGAMLASLPPEVEPDPAANARWERLQSCLRDPG